VGGAVAAVAAAVARPRFRRIRRPERHSLSSSLAGPVLDPFSKVCSVLCVDFTAFYEGGPRFFVWFARLVEVASARYHVAHGVAAMSVQLLVVVWTDRY
jgi:hypothetical protein